MSRTLYGIGAGPGDPELITLLGLRRLREASCVFLPSTRPSASYARSIVSGYLEPERQSVIELICPAYRDRAAIETRWLDLAQLVLDSIADGSTGAFVCEGDPSLYSTFLYLREGLRRLNADLTIVTVPGIDSVTACAALAEMPLAAWNERLLITPAVRDTESLQELLSQARTVALLKTAGPLDSLADAIQRLGAGVDATLVRRAGRPEQHVLRDLDAIRASESDYFTTVILRGRER